MTDPAFNPYANALALPFANGRDWFRQARTLWLQHWLFFSVGSLLVLLARWQLDLMDGGVIIVLSYFTDALIFGLIYFAVREHQATAESLALLFAFRLKKGRLKEIALCGLWGLPAAAASYLIFLAGPEVIKSLVFMLGSTSLGLIGMLALFLIGGFAAFLASLLPILAAIQVVRDPSADFRAAGLWAFRGMRSGWRPLAVVFMAFVTASFAAGALLTPLFGYIPTAVFGTVAFDQILYWFPWPGLFVAMNLFVALIFPMADDLMRAADHDLSDEVFDPVTRERTGAGFVGLLLDRTGFALASLAAFGILFWVVAGALMQAGGYADQWLVIAVIGFLWSRTFRKSAAAWREGGSYHRRFRFVWMFVVWAVVYMMLDGVATFLTHWH
ncbi:MAG: hypothetical protein HGA75_06545 [Thiobacillus sp.]|nr:hypothetical protein [Thiobacillus sp.]